MEREKLGDILLKLYMSGYALGEAGKKPHVVRLNESLDKIETIMAEAYKKGYIEAGIETLKVTND